MPDINPLYDGQEVCFRYSDRPNRVYAIIKSDVSVLGKNHVVALFEDLDSPAVAAMDRLEPWKEIEPSPKKPGLFGRLLQLLGVCK